MTFFPRLYLDADILLSVDAIRRTVKELTAVSTPRLAAPKIHIADSTNRAARSYGRIGKLPYVRSHVPGVGFYAVNEAGRGKWWCFPTRMGADDKFVRLHFGNNETVVIEDAFFVVFLPERLSELIRVRGRWTSLNREIARRSVEIARHAPDCIAGTTLAGFRRFAMPRLIFRSGRICQFFWQYGRAGGCSRFLRTDGVGERWSRATSSKPRAMSLSGASLPETSGMIASTQPIKTSEQQRSLHVVIVTYNSATTAPRCVEPGNRSAVDLRKENPSSLRQGPSSDPTLRSFTTVQGAAPIGPPLCTREPSGRRTIAP